MSSPGKETETRLIEACISVISSARRKQDVSVRAIAQAAGTSPTALYGYYACLEDLVGAAAKSLYRRVNHERMVALQQAVEDAGSGTPSVRRILDALIGPPVRWSLDLRLLVDHVDQYRPFIRHLHQAAPWYDEAEIGWRVNATLGVRSQVLREGRRTRLLTQGRLDLQDPSVVIALILDVTEPMFGCRQTNSSQSQLGKQCCPLPRAETAPLGESVDFH